MNKLTDASVYSKAHHIVFGKAVTKPGIEKLVKQLIQDIGRPLSHNGIIVGHIKVLVKLPDEEFIFVSLTRLDRVDVRFSTQWATDLVNEFNSINLDINVLIFGYNDAVIAEAVDASLAALRKESTCN